MKDVFFGNEIIIMYVRRKRACRWINENDNMVLTVFHTLNSNIIARVVDCGADEKEKVKLAMYISI